MDEPAEPGHIPGPDLQPANCLLGKSLLLGLPWVAAVILLDIVLPPALAKSGAYFHTLISETPPFVGQMP